MPPFVIVEKNTEVKERNERIRTKVRALDY